MRQQRRAMMRLAPSNRPEHPRLLEAGADHSFATSFDETGTDKQTWRPKLRVAHFVGVAFKVFGLRLQLFSQFRALAGEGAEPGHQGLDCAVIELVHGQGRPTAASCVVAWEP